MIQLLKWCGQRDSNPRHRLRRPVLYPVELWPLILDCAHHNKKNSKVKQLYRSQSFLCLSFVQHSIFAMQNSVRFTWFIQLDIAQYSHYL